jgi:hypothetical protein
MPSKVHSGDFSGESAPQYCYLTVFPLHLWCFSSVAPPSLTWSLRKTWSELTLFCSSYHKAGKLDEQDNQYLKGKTMILLHQPWGLSQCSPMFYHSQTGCLLSLSYLPCFSHCWEFLSCSHSKTTKNDLIEETVEQWSLDTGESRRNRRVGGIAWIKYSEEQLDPVFCSAVVSENYKTYTH